MAAEYVSLVVNPSDGQGDPVVAGTATFTLNAVLTDSADQILATGVPVIVELASPPPTVELIANNSPGAVPAGSAWTVQLSYPGAPAAYQISVDYTLGATQHLSDYAPAQATAPMASYAELGGDLSGVPAQVTGTHLASPMPVAQGGTGQASQQAALDALAGAVTAGEVLAGDGTHVSLRALASGDLPAATTSAKGAVVLDGAAGDVAASPGTAAAGATGKAADAGHVHPQPAMFAPAGLTGATAASRYVGATASGAPGSGTFAAGDFVIDQSGKVWVCVAAGSPGAWTAAGGGGGSFYGGLFGDGSDGPATLDGAAAVPWASLAGGVYTMSRDSFCTGLTVDTGVTLVTNGYRIFTAGPVANYGTISWPASPGSGGGGAGSGQGSGNPLSGGNDGGSGGTGAGGNGTNGGTGIGVGSGGTGGSGSSGAGGGGGGTSGASAGLFRTPWIVAGPCSVGQYGTQAHQVSGGTGGGGGGGDSANSGGGGGGGGPVIVLLAHSVANDGTITAKGGDGGTPAAGNCGGGGGGGGGLVLVYTLSQVTGTGAVDVTGGSGGSGSGTGTAGADGGAGTYLNVLLA